MSLYFAPTSRKYASRIASVLTSGMPQIAASTARRSIVRRARSSAENGCAFADTATQTTPNAAEMIFLIAPLPPYSYESHRDEAASESRINSRLIRQYKGFLD